ncbi:MAG: hypothetical protein ABR985_02690 [Methanotrichaceae archaeon]
MAKAVWRAYGAHYKWVEETQGEPLNAQEVLIKYSDVIMATCTFCGKPAEKEVGKKGVCQVCAGEIIETFKEELKGKSSKPK